MSRLRAILPWCCLLAAAILPGCGTTPPPSDLRLNQIQVIGTHNSYHQRTHGSLWQLIAKSNPQAAASLDYTHRTLETQFERLGIRQIELDCLADPRGGLYAEPLGPKRAASAGLPSVPNHDPEGKLRRPGIKVLHVPDIDYFTSALTLVDGLKQVRSWSDRHPNHVPIFILIELKEDSLGPGFTQPVPFDKAALEELETEIASVFPREKILTPDRVRGDAATLPEALKTRGWPRLDEVRGLVMFGLDNEGAVRDRYLEDHPALAGRLMFVSVDPEHPAAAWMKRNDAVGQFNEIQKLVRDGFLVRTRADADTVQARKNDPTTRDRAFASGAQFVSTDYPEPDPRFSTYQVRFEGGSIARSNPVSRPLTWITRESERRIESHR